VSTIAIVPVRAPGEGKSRLAGVLSPLRRASLVQGMLGRVLGELRATRGITSVIVVTPDASWVLPSGIETLHDAGSGLNDAVALALGRIAGRAEGALVVAADAPRATAAEFERILDAARATDVVVVPDRRGQGTNALWLRLPSGIAPGQRPASRRRGLCRGAACLDAGARGPVARHRRSGGPWPGSHSGRAGVDAGR
jgi:2-phospho-L-lactate guanylyltransferase